MTPGKKTPNSTTILVERRPMAVENQAEDIHVAGGAHKGIIINKNASLVEQDPKSADVSLEFCVFLVSAVTGMHKKYFPK